MPIYNVITESGADYMIDTDAGFWNHRGTGIERIWVFKVGGEVSNYDLLMPWHEYADAQWEDATEPVVGKRIYLTSRDYWRISTPVVSFTIEEDS